MLLFLALQTEDGVLLLSQSGAGGFQFIVRQIALAVGLGQLGGEGAALLLQDLDGLGQAFDLVGAAEHAGVLADAAAGHRAAGVHDLPVEGDDLERAAVAAGDRDRVVQTLCDHGAAQKVLHDGPVFAPALDQLGGDPNEAGAVLQTGLVQRPAANGGERKEGRPARVAVFELLDGVFAVLLGADHDILHGGSEGDLNGDGNAVFDRDQPGDRAVHVAKLAGLRLLHHEADRLGEALVFPLHLAEHISFGGCGLQLDAQTAVLLQQLLGLGGAGLAAQLVARCGVAQAPDRLAGLRERLCTGLQIGLGALTALGGAVGVGAKLGHPVAALLRGGKQGGVIRRPGGKLRRGGAVKPAQLQIAAVQALGGIGQLFEVGLPRRDQRLGLGAPAVDLREPVPALVHLRMDAAGALRLLVQLPAELFEILFRVAAVGLQDGLPGGKLLTLRVLGLDPGALVFDAHVPVAERLVERLGFAVERLQIVVLPAQDEAGGGVILRGLLCSGVQTDEGLQPDRNLLALELGLIFQIFFRLFGLLPQGLHLKLQLGDLILNAGQILLRAFQTALGLLLAVAVFGDARRLLEDLAAVGALDGKDLVDPALGDVGVALAAKTGIHEQLVHVLEPDRLLIQIEFVLPGAVVAPGDHHLVGINGEITVGVVEDQAGLGKAELGALLRAAEDHVLHLVPAQGAGALLAHDPADRVRDVGLARPVRADDGRDVVAEAERDFIRKGLEALYVQRFQIHLGRS